MCKVGIMSGKKKISISQKKYTVYKITLSLTTLVLLASVVNPGSGLQVSSFLTWIYT